MTVRTPPNNLQNATTHTAAGDRALIYSQFGGREGVTGQNDLLVKQNGTPNMSVLVSAGRCVVFGDSNADQQLYHMWNDADVNLVISAADPTNPRRDLIIAEVRDTLYGGAADDWRLRVVTGAPAGAPVDPATPANAIVLARVAVAASATSITNANITDLRPKAGSIASCDIICTSTTRPSNPFVGMKIYEMDTARALVYAGATSGWNPPWNVAWGCIARAKVVTVAGGYTGTIADATGLTVSAPMVAGRRYRIQLHAEVASSAGGDVGVMQLTDGSNTQIARSVMYFGVTGAAQTIALTYSEDAVSTGSVTRKCRYSRVIGSGTHSIEASATTPAFLIVEDIGPSANPT